MIEVVHSEVGGRGGVALAESLTKLSGSSIITPDAPLEAFARSKFGLPAKEEEEEDENESPINPFLNPNDQELSSEEGMEQTNSPENNLQNKQVELSRSNTVTQAKKSVRRLEQFKQLYEKKLTNGLKTLIEKKVKKITAVLNKSKKEFTPLKYNDLEVSIAPLLKELKKISVDYYISEYEDTEAIFKTTALAKIPKGATQLMVAALIQADIKDIDTKLNDIAIYTYLNSQFKQDKLSDAVTTIAIHNQLNKFVEEKAAITKLTVLPSQIQNQARETSFSNHINEIESYTYYNPSPQSAICEYLNGKTIAITDADTGNYIPPLHYNCKTVRIPNLRKFKNNPVPSKLTPNKKQIESIDIGVKS